MISIGKGNYFEKNLQVSSFQLFPANYLFAEHHKKNLYAIRATIFTFGYFPQNYSFISPLPTNIILGIILNKTICNKNITTHPHRNQMDAPSDTYCYGMIESCFFHCFVCWMCGDGGFQCSDI